MGVSFLPSSGATAEEITAISANLSALGYIVNITSQGGTAIQGPTMYYEDFETEGNIAFNQNFVFDSANTRMTSNIGGVVAQNIGTVGGWFTSGTGGGNAAAFDGVTEQPASGGAARTANQSINTDVWLGKDWGLGNEKIVTQAKVWGASDAGHSNANAFQLSLYGSTGITGTTNKSPAGTIVNLGTTGQISEVENSNPQIAVSTDNSTAYRYHWVKHDIFNTSQSPRYIGEIEFTEAIVTPRILTSTPKVFTEQPSVLQATIFFTQVDSIDPSDFVFEVSRDGGTTFNIIPLAQLGIQVINANKILTGAVDIGSQPTGTNIVYRLTNSTLKNYFIEQIHIQKVG